MKLQGWDVSFPYSVLSLGIKERVISLDFSEVIPFLLIVIILSHATLDM